MKKRILGERRERLKKKKQTKSIKKLKPKIVIYNLLKILAVLLVIYNIIFFTNSVIYKNKYLKFSKINILYIDTNSMKGDINKWSLVVTKNVSESKLNNKDIIAYEINGNIRISKIVNQYTDNNGKKIYIAKANSNYYPDNKEISYNQIIGKKICSISGLGIFVKIIQSKILSFVFLVILIVIFINTEMKIKRIKRIKHYDDI